MAPRPQFRRCSTEVAPGTLLRAHLSNGSEIDGEYEFTVLHYEAPRRLVWEGGISGVVMGQHSFVLDPHDDGTRYTESEVFTGPAAVETVEPNRAKMEESSAIYGRAMQKHLESGR